MPVAVCLLFNVPETCWCMLLFVCCLTSLEHAGACCCLLFNVPGTCWCMLLFVCCLTSLEHAGACCCLLFNVPGTCWCISGTDQLGQLYMLPHTETEVTYQTVSLGHRDTDTAPTRRLAWQAPENQLLSQWYDSTWKIFHRGKRDSLPGLPVSPLRWPSGKASDPKAEGPEFESRLRRDFSGSSHTSDLKIGTPVATLPGAWR